LGQREEELAAYGAQIAAVAVTATYSQMAFGRHLGVGFPMLSDWSGDVASAYGVRYDVWKGHEGVAKRALFVIAPDGRVRFVWVSDDAQVLPDLDEVVAAVAELGAGAPARDGG
jgi:peroxiredoxin